MDDLLGDYEVLRAVVMTLLVAYYRARPGDTRFEKSILAAMPAARRANASAQLDQLIEAAKKLARRAEAERRRQAKAALPGAGRAER
jgi:hypothetical protein